MKIIAISDVHGKWNKLKIPDCDLLISAGDYSFTGEKHIVKDFHSWLNRQPAKYIISVNGNHETFKDVVSGRRNFNNNMTFNEAEELATSVCPRINFIGSHKTLIIEDIKIHGSAITPYFFDWAWNRTRGEEIDREWNNIPIDTEILITHGPPYGILDIVDRDNHPTRVGCEMLSRRIEVLKNLKLHIFGHLHRNNGKEVHNGVTYINASICDENYKATQPYQEFIFKKKME